MTRTVSKKTGRVTSDLLTFFFFFFGVISIFEKRKIRPPQELGKCEWKERGGEMNRGMLGVDNISISYKKTQGNVQQIFELFELENGSK